MNQIKKLRPLVQLVPAVAVAAIVLVTLPRTLLEKAVGAVTVSVIAKEEAAQ